MKRQRPAIERGAELLAALSLCGAAAFAILQTVPLAGVALAGAMTLGGLAAGAGALALLGRIDRIRNFGEAGSFEPGELVGDADDFTVDEDELLLDDPIVQIEPESRVIQLFEPNQPEPLPEPGEMVARIADYLGSDRGAAAHPGEPVRHDASAALHAALADIRRSLR